MGVQRSGRILVIAVLAVLLAGCAAEPIPEATQTPSFSTEAEAFAAAEATYRAYVDALNQVDLADPETFEAVYAWTTGEANEQSRESLSQMHADGWTVTGVSDVERTEWLGTDPEIPVIGACLDVSTVDVYDAEGASVVASTRPDLQSLRIEFSLTSKSRNGLAVEKLVGYEPAQPC